MKICGNNPLCAICIPQSIEAKDLAITLVAIAAIGILLVGSLQLGGVISIGLLGNYAWILVGGGGCILAVDTLLAIVKKYFTSEFSQEIEDGDLIPDLSVKSEHVSEIYQELNNAVSESNPDVDSICEISNRLADAVKFLNPAERETNKDLLNAIITLKILIKERWADEINQSKLEVSGKVSNKTIFSLRQALKKLQTNCLTYYFKTKLNDQKQILINLKHQRKKYKKIKNPAEPSEENLQFIDSELNRWEKRLALGKPVGFPKWYHCTTKVKTVSAILDSSIKVLHQGQYCGAFVSNHPETINYGDYGFALSSHIEETATLNGKQLPKLSKKLGEDKVHYGQPQADLKSCADRVSDVVLWVGFQNEIPIKMDPKKNNPLDFYKNRATIAYIFYASNENYDKDLPQLRELAKTSKIALTSYNNLFFLGRLFNITYPLTLPQEWKGKLADCTN